MRQEDPTANWPDARTARRGRAPTANGAIDTTRAYAQNAVNAAGEKVRDLRRDAEPAVEPSAARVQQAVQRGLDAASTTSAPGPARLEAAADVTGKHIADQPVRSVLVAAAAGAATRR